MNQPSSLITDEVVKIVGTVEWPKRLIWDVIEREFQLQFVLYRDNFESFDGVDKEYIAGLVGKTITQIRGIGIPCFLQVKKGDGKHVPRSSVAHQ